jgi:predicted regulator of Ras-like GTPase activity (Roadblock/LC7/MglB family)
MPKKRKNEQIAAEAEPAEIEATPEDELRAGLEEIKQYEGVIGYILRNTKTAAVDLKDPTKISDYAILSSSALETSEELSELLDLGNVKNIVVEGKDAKVLSLTSGENKISVFMEKDIEHSKALAKLQSL